MAKLVDRMRMSHGEYRANITGLNIFFGAVLGFVLAGTETLEPLPFALLLAMTAGVVISILYITASDKRLSYAIMTLVLIALMSQWADPLLPKDADLPSKLQPTLAIWALMTIFVEFMPRERGAVVVQDEET